MILRDGDEKLTLNMTHNTSSYSNQPHKESINMIDFCNVSYEDYLQDLFVTNHLSGNPTSISDPIVSSSPTLTSLEKRSGYQQKDRKPSQNDKTEHGMEKTVQNQGQSPKMPKSESIQKNQQANQSRNEDPSLRANGRSLERELWLNAPSTHRGGVGWVRGGGRNPIPEIVANNFELSKGFNQSCPEQTFFGS
ncbi:hypothetical protein Tco_1162883 [Tanacetum coccineum]